MKFVNIGILGVIGVVAGCVAPINTPVAVEPSKPIEQPVQTVIKNTGKNVDPAKLDVASIDARQEAKAEVAKAELTPLGTAVASLGNPALTGFWAKTSLVSEPSKGQISYLETGKTVNVELIPRQGSMDAIEVSLSALRVIDAPLAGLPKVSVSLAPAM